MEFVIQKVAQSRASEVDFEAIQFGKNYADHMFVMDYENGEWQQAHIMPYGDIALSPATTFIHYGQAIFEGIKAYKTADGTAHIFRPQDNCRRMNISAARMAMPAINEELFLKALNDLIKIDSAWIPTTEGSSLYIRPFMFATDEFIGVKPAESFRFMIITSPAADYYANPIKIYIQDKYVRAFPGGIGFTKAAGNYGGSMLPTSEIRKLGFDQILWTDGFEHKYVQEIGTMNVFFVINNVFVTPQVSETILDGFTRRSVIELCKSKGIEVQERPLSIDEIFEAHQNGHLEEVFGAGTAATIAPIASLTYKDKTIELPPVQQWKYALNFKKELAQIKTGVLPDLWNWNYKVQ